MAVLQERYVDQSKLTLGKGVVLWERLKSAHQPQSRRPEMAGRWRQHIHHVSSLASELGKSAREPNTTERIKICCTSYFLGTSRGRMAHD
jgi:hypothetical protein